MSSDKILEGVKQSLQTFIFQVRSGVKYLTDEDLITLNVMLKDQTAEVENTLFWEAATRSLDSLLGLGPR